jgi:hypothetical protein
MMKMQREYGQNLKTIYRHLHSSNRTGQALTKIPRLKILHDIEPFIETTGVFETSVKFLSGKVL